MKNLVLIIALVFFSAGSFAQTADDVVGKWLNKDKDAHIQISKKGDRYYGKIIWLKNPKDENGNAKLDAKNPKSELQGRPILGLEILNNFRYKDKSWEDGTIYDPKSGKIYSCKLTLTGNNKLNVRGYVGISLIGRTDVWTRIIN